MKDNFKTYHKTYTSAHHCMLYICGEGRYEWFDLPVQVLLSCYAQQRLIFTHMLIGLNIFTKQGIIGGDYKQIVDMKFDGYH